MVQIISPIRILIAITKGQLPLNIIKGFDTVKLQEIYDGGTDIEKMGCQVD